STGDSCPLRTSSAWAVASRNARSSVIWGTLRPTGRAGPGQAFDSRGPRHNNTIVTSSRRRPGAKDVTSSTQRLTIASASSGAAPHTRSVRRWSPNSLPAALRTSMSPSVYTASMSPGSQRFVGGEGEEPRDGAVPGEVDDDQPEARRRELDHVVAVPGDDALSRLQLRGHCPPVGQVLDARRQLGPELEHHRRALFDGL